MNLSVNSYYVAPISFEMHTKFDSVFHATHTKTRQQYPNTNFAESDSVTYEGSMRYCEVKSN